MSLVITPDHGFGAMVRVEPIEIGSRWTPAHAVHRGADGLFYEVNSPIDTASEALVQLAVLQRPITAADGERISAECCAVEGM